MVRMKAGTHRWLVWILLTLGAIFMSSVALRGPDRSFAATEDKDLAYLFLLAAGYVAAAGWWSTLMGWHTLPPEDEAGPED